MLTENSFYVEFDSFNHWGMEMESTDNTFDTGMSSQVSVVTADMDHATAKNRELPDQHPISAISDLSEELDERVEITSTIPDSDIIALL